MALTYKYYMDIIYLISSISALQPKGGLQGITFSLQINPIKTSKQVSGLEDAIGRWGVS
jgi:hypothetical protein